MVKSSLRERNSVTGKRHCSRGHSYAGAGLIALLGCMIARGAPPRTRQPYTTWSDYGGAADSMQYSALKQITTRNVNQLELVWSYKVPDHRGSFGFNPVIAGNVMYVLGQNNAIVALDASTG
ncbi:MAG TPA: PQQ-binding-like beta-propeller repeat protein, partial [Gemmataceae bacterium]|nr:PQQ-binding-like beta-propeller repeat protein [Gemmataceae bacterium]